MVGFVRGWSYHGVGLLTTGLLHLLFLSSIIFVLLSQVWGSQVILDGETASLVADQDGECNEGMDR